MKIEKTHYGLKITLPETEYSSEFVYSLRNVRVLNDNDPNEQMLLDELEKREKPLVRQFILRAWSMWNYIKRLTDDNISQIWEVWEIHNRMEWNRWYHDAMREMEEQINEISCEYCERSEHGWCY